MRHKNLLQAVRSELREEKYLIIKEIIIWIVITFAGCSVFYSFMSLVISRTERKECMKWIRWQTEYQQFVISPIMQEQCKQYNINLKQ